MCEEVCRTTVVCFDLVAIAAAVQLCRPKKETNSGGSCPFRAPFQKSVLCSGCVFALAPSI